MELDFYLTFLYIASLEVYRDLYRRIVHGNRTWKSYMGIVHGNVQGKSNPSYGKCVRGGG